MSRLFGVYGASGCGRGIMPLLRAEHAAEDAQLVFIYDAPSADRLNGHRVLTFDQSIAEPATSHCAVVTIANSNVRETLDRRCAAAGIEVIGTRASNVVGMDDVDIAPDALLSPSVALTSNIRYRPLFSRQSLFLCRA